MRKLGRAVTAGLTSVILVGSTLSTAIAAEDEATGSLGDTTAELDMAQGALSGPVQVVRDGENVNVNYTNETDAAQKCSGLVLPYGEVEERGLQDVDMENADVGQLISDFTEILGTGKGAVFSVNLDGSANVIAGEEAAASVLGVGLAGAAFPGTLGEIPAGETFTWTVPKEDHDTTAVVLCDGNFLAGQSPTKYQGIERDVYFGQLQDKLGPVGSGVELSSQNDAIAGSLVQGIPLLSGFLKLLDSIFGGLVDLLGFLSGKSGETDGS